MKVGLRPNDDDSCGWYHILPAPAPPFPLTREHRFDPGVVGPNDHAVGLEEVVDRGALLEELRVRDDGHAMLCEALDNLAHPGRGPYCHGGLDDDDLVLGKNPIPLNN